MQEESVTCDASNFKVPVGPYNGLLKSNSFCFDFSELKVLVKLYSQLAKLLGECVSESRKLLGGLE